MHCFDGAWPLKVGLCRRNAHVDDGIPRRSGQNQKAGPIGIPNVDLTLAVKHDEHFTELLFFRSFFFQNQKKTFLAFCCCFFQPEKTFLSFLVVFFLFCGSLSSPSNPPAFARSWRCSARRAGSLSRRSIAQLEFCLRRRKALKKTKRRKEKKQHGFITVYSVIIYNWINIIVLG